MNGTTFYSTITCYILFWTNFTTRFTLLAFDRRIVALALLALVALVVKNL